MNISFDQFSTRSFERFSQSLAQHILGAGILVFGDGPDGAREASFEGTLNYPTVADRWTGYTVMQAKFLQVPRSPKDDADWLCTQLQEELQKFASPSSTLKKPDYYILISNARLSPMPEGKRGKGGIEKVDSVFAEYKKKIGIKDYRVWHLDQITTMLAGANELRRSYAAWLCTSDVIADLLKEGEAKARAVSDAMYRYLTREIRSHQQLRLQQAGHAGDAQTMIEDVFVDLPYRESGHVSAKEKDTLLLAHLLDRSRDCLDGASVHSRLSRNEDRRERVLLLGGPGQGKSTLSQFLAQIFRANILNAERVGGYPAEIGSIVRKTIDKAKSAGLAINVPRRYPMRVDLPNFADWIAREENRLEKSLLHYLCHHITSISNTKVEISDLRHWINRYPSIVLLDGLDEVPPSANRSSVIRAINEFWDEASGADVLMVVTTRPQGYNDDLDPDFYSKLEMTPLTVEHAIAYSEKLAGARLSDVFQRERVISRLREAAKSPMTSRLMISPLQVAILLALIDQRGDAPTDRWSLFDKYFGVILQREQSKSGAVGETMRHWARQIAAIHFKAGFILHSEAEAQGGSDSHLDKHSLEALIRGQLESEGYDGAELDRFTEELMGASTERLVLLVQRVENCFSFEVRSLQEFMAAAYLMAGKESVVQRRLRAIVTKTHWLHVFQIAASKCFSVNDSEQYRDSIITICREINESGEELDRLLRTGSRIAFALLQDGVAYDQPKYRRILFSEAFGVLHVGPNELPDEFCELCNQDQARASEYIRIYIKSPFEDTSKAAWKLLLRCAARGFKWAEDLVQEWWPNHSRGVEEILEYEIVPVQESRLNDLICNSLPYTSPLLLRKALVRGRWSRLRNKYRPFSVMHPCLELFTGMHGDRISISLRLESVKTPVDWFAISIVLREEVRAAYEAMPATPLWEPLFALRVFHEQPTANSLADLLEQIEMKNWRELFVEVLPLMPWPLGSLLNGRSAGTLGTLAAEVRAGKFGDIADWLAAEDRWRNAGLVDADLVFASSGESFDAEVARVGFPSGGFSLSHGEKDNQWINNLAEKYFLSTGFASEILGALLRFVLSVYRMPRRLTVEEAAKILASAVGSNNWVDIDFLINLPADFFDNTELILMLDSIGKDGRVMLSSKSPENVDWLFRLRDRLPSHPGLLVVIVNFMSEASLEDFERVFCGVDLNRLSKSDSERIGVYAKLVSAIIGVLPENDYKNLLVDGSDMGRSVQVRIVDAILDNELLDPVPNLRIANSIALVANIDRMLPVSRYTSRLQSIADGRRAELADTKRWRDLEFDAKLCNLMKESSLAA